MEIAGNYSYNSLKTSGLVSCKTAGYRPDMSLKISVLVATNMAGNCPDLSNGWKSS